MKNIFRIVSIIFAFMMLVCVSACEVYNPQKDTEQTTDTYAFATPKEVGNYSSSLYKTEDYKRFKESLDQFSAEFTSAIYNQTPDKNHVVSPVSVFSALSLVSACTAGKTQQEILDALNLDYQTLKNNFPLLFSRLNQERKMEGKLIEKLSFTNSIWMNSNIPFNQSLVSTLENDFFSYGYLADFTGDNQKACNDIENFIKQATNGLIDPTLIFDIDTVAVLMNTLYLKDLWDCNGNTLPFTKDEQVFTKIDGTHILKKFLKGFYETGKPYVEQTFSHFYAKTLNGYKIKFIVPNEGYTINDVWNTQNIKKITNFNSYETVSHEKRELYYTNCIFPCFEASYDDYISSLLKNSFGINDLFNKNNCDMTPLTSHTPTYAEEIRHITTFTVDEYGIEGAAVTLMATAISEPPPDYEEVYYNLLVDKAFGFIITDFYDIPLFSGIINEI